MSGDNDMADMAVMNGNDHPGGHSMDRMGNHSALKGLRGDDGAASVPVVQPLALPSLLMPRPAPVLGPPPPDGHADIVTDKRRDIDGDKIRRASMWVLASGVAAIAAIVSYSHIYDLGRAHGGSGVAARLLPLSVDMLILVGELMLLHEADAKGRRFALGWVLVWSGILATLAANVTYGAQYGAVGALIWGWPAYSFILAAGGMVAVVKRGAVRDDAAPAPDSPATPEPLAATTAESLADANGSDKRDDTSAPSKPPRQTPKRTSGRDKAAAVIRRNPGLPDAEVAKRASVSVRTVQRARPKE